MSAPALRRLLASRAALAALLALGALLLYVRTGGYPFILFDDGRYVTENARVRAGLSWDNAGWALTALAVSNWHPLTWLSHMLDVQLFGLDAGAHHLVNAALHAANGALLFLALSRMTGAPGRSAVVAALFAVHPLHVESVAWVAERKDVLSTLFGLAALLAWTRYAARPGPLRYLAALACFALSLMAKPMWVTLPFLLLLLDGWPLQRLAGSPLPVDPLPPALPRQPLARLLVEKLPLLALSAASSALTVVAQDRGGALTGLELGPGIRVGNALVAYARYLGKTLWPSSLAVFYPFSAGGLPAWQVLGAGALLAGLTALAVLSARRQPWLAVGWCWFLGTLVPVIGLVQVGGQSMADRYTYLPIVGLFLAAAWGLHALAGAWRGGLPLRAAAALLLAALSAVTLRQLGHWSSHEALFRHALGVTDDNALAHGALSDGLRVAGRLDEAIGHAREAVRLDPGSARHWNNLGMMERELKRLPEARAALDRSVQLNPAYALAWLNLGEVAADQGRPDEAAAAFQEAARLRPEDGQPRYKLGVLLQRAGRFDAAVEAYREAVRLQPDHAAAWSSLGILYQGSGRTAEAGEAFQAAARARPEDASTWRNLGVWLGKAGRPGEAAQALERALALKPGDPDLLHRAGLAAAALGQRERALQLAAALEAVDPGRAADLRGRLR